MVGHTASQQSFKLLPQGSAYDLGGFLLTINHYRLNWVRFSTLVKLGKNQLPKRYASYNHHLYRGKPIPVVFVELLNEGYLPV
jgi:hypothetical protein